MAVEVHKYRDRAVGLGLRGFEKLAAAGGEIGVVAGEIIGMEKK